MVLLTHIGSYTELSIHAIGHSRLYARMPRYIDGHTYVYTCIRCIRVYLRVYVCLSIYACMSMYVCMPTYVCIVFVCMDGRAGACGEARRGGKSRGWMWRHHSKCPVHPSASLFPSEQHSSAFSTRKEDALSRYPPPPPFFLSLPDNRRPFHSRKSTRRREERERAKKSDTLDVAGLALLFVSLGCPYDSLQCRPDRRRKTKEKDDQKHLHNRLN